GPQRTRGLPRRALREPPPQGGSRRGRRPDARRQPRVRRIRHRLSQGRRQRGHTRPLLDRAGRHHQHGRDVRRRGARAEGEPLAPGGPRPQLREVHGLHRPGRDRLPHPQRDPWPLDAQERREKVPAGPPHEDRRILRL
ncbi:MAG: Putative iron-sulfur cluster assembly scaffold protein for SUF system, SufE2, partial [uncultured Rubrobacteraceae bacterium]